MKKQLSELRGFFKGKERKSLEGKIELLEDLEKRLHKSMEQIVKREGYPNVQSFQKVYNKAEDLIIEYNEELRAWKNQTEQKKEKPYICKHALGARFGCECRSSHLNRSN